MGGLISKGWYSMFFACGIWCLADVLSVSTSSEQTIVTPVQAVNLVRSEGLAQLRECIFHRCEVLKLVQNG